MYRKFAFAFVLLFGLIQGQLENTYTTEQSGDGTYYGTQDGSGGACSIYPSPSFVSNGVTKVAINAPQYSGSLACGMCMQVNGNGKGSGANPIKGTFLAFVDDLCPECKTGALDLALNGDGRWDISWVAVDCPVQGNLQYAFQGSNAWYIKMQVRNHRIPVQSVQFREPNGKFIKGSRTSDNFFEVPSYPYPVSFPLAIQVQGLDGKWVDDTVPSMSSNTVNGLANVQLGSMNSASNAEAASDSSFTDSSEPQSSNVDPTLVAVLLGAAFIVLVSVVIAIVLLARARHQQMETESKP